MIQVKEAPRQIQRTSAPYGRSLSQPIRIAIAGVGNCASALVQGVNFYGNSRVKTGLLHSRIGAWGPGDVEFVAAFDVDERKVGRPLSEAIFAAPNCAEKFCPKVQAPVKVKMGPLLDGVAAHTQEYPEEQRPKVAQQSPVEVADELRLSGAELLVCYLPVGSEQAVRHYAQACLEAGVGFINCIPVFIASDPKWAERFRKAGLPLVGDDVKSQVGATILHRALARLCTDRGLSVRRTYQLNVGGNTDFLNMLDGSRLQSKKHSKTESVQSELDQRLAPDDIHIGPSDYVPWQKDNKVAFLGLEATGFGGLPVELEVRLSVQDSPNSAGVVLDAIRCAKLALEKGISGPLEAVSACYMKYPPRQMRDSKAQRETLDFIRSYRPSQHPDR